MLWLQDDSEDNRNKNSREKINRHPRSEEEMMSEKTRNLKCDSNWKWQGFNSWTVHESDSWIWSDWDPLSFSWEITRQRTSPRLTRAIHSRSASPRPLRFGNPCFPKLAAVYEKLPCCWVSGSQNICGVGKWGGGVMMGVGRQAWSTDRGTLSQGQTCWHTSGPWRG